MLSVPTSPVLHVYQPAGWPSRRRNQQRWVKPTVAPSTTFARGVLRDSFAVEMEKRGAEIDFNRASGTRLDVKAGGKVDGLGSGCCSISRHGETSGVEWISLDQVMKTSFSFGFVSQRWQRRPKVIQLLVSNRRPVLCQESLFGYHPQQSKEA